jgi:hypothetical protein
MTHVRVRPWGVRLLRKQARRSGIPGRASLEAFQGESGTRSGMLYTLNWGDRRRMQNVLSSQPARRAGRGLGRKGDQSAVSCVQTLTRVVPDEAQSAWRPN